MSDHEFEKQVRQKLDDLRITPTDKAWQNIEQGIGDTRKRRVPIFWLPLLLAGLGAGGYFMWADRNNQTPAGKELSQVSPPVSNHSENLHSSPKTNETGQKPADLDRIPSAGERATNIRPDIDPVQSVSGRVRTPIRETNREENAVQKVKQPESSAGIDNLSRDTRSDVPSSNNEKTIAYYTALLPTKTPLVPKPVSDQMAKESVHVPGLSDVAAPPVIQQVRKWSYGISGFAGVSGLNNGNLFNLEKSLAADMQTPINAAFAPSYTPYKIIPGTAFSIGFTIKRELSNRFQISSGLSYLQLSTKYKLGNQVYGSQVLNAAPPLNQFVRNYFTLDQRKPQDYRNAYHFAEVPVTLHTRVSKSQKLPLYWNAGLAYSRLIRSNSKQFDGSTGIYYSNEKLINKNQLSISTGIDVILFGRSTHPLWIGPSVKYNVTKLANESLTDKKNLLSAGMSMKFFLK